MFRAVRNVHNVALSKANVFKGFVKSKFATSASTATAGAGALSDKVHPAVSAWVFGMGGMVALMVTVGGVTRLTKSGLSMTSWKLQGSLPPMTPEEWNAEFERYKSFPEYQQRKSMDVEEFKSIYFWEYSHRMLGRSVGLVFLLPFTYFSAKKMIPRHLYGRLATLFGLGGLQGAIGWWMVKSGLNNADLQHRLEKNQEIRVSAYRLATHLSMAFVTYGLLLWTGLDTVNLFKMKEYVAEKAALLTKEQVKKFVRVRQLALAQGGLVLATAISGAFVAGNDAGLAYNTFPKMGDHWFPPMETLTELTPLYRNFFENTATVQMDHRILALSTFTSIWALYLPLKLSKSSLLGLKAFPRLTQVSLTALTHASLLQVGLGIATLLNYVPLGLAVAHQAGSVLVLTCSAFFVHSLKFIKYLK